MELVNKAEDVYTLIQKVKAGSASFITNLFIEPEKLNDWINNKLLYVEELTGVLFFYRKNKHFYNLFYCTGSLSILSDLLLKNMPTEKIVVEIVGKEEDNKPLVSVFSNAGFNMHGQLNRYIRINNADSNYYQPFEIAEIANENDVPLITHMLETGFDKYAEQIPHAEEVKRMIQEKMIRVIKEQDIIKGLLVRKSTGQTTILNFILVDERYRGEKIGSTLLKNYIFESRNVKRMILWVMANNSTAIKLYKNHNYLQDTLIDDIMIKN